MTFDGARRLTWILYVTLMGCTIAHARCPAHVVIVKGRVEQAPHDATVRVQLIYAKDAPGESGSMTAQGGRFNIPIEFLTQSRRGKLVGSLAEKCDRIPKAVVITLVKGDQEYARVALDFAKDFEMTDASAYTLRSEVVLSGAH